MTPTANDLTALIGSRICHDLISPLGAIGNGVELLAMSGDAKGPEMGLISESVENANARIRFFRIAFGATAEGQSVGRSESVSILHDISRDGRLVIEWQPEGDMPRSAVKLAFLLLQCFETAMPWGGKVTVSVVGDQWAVTGEADKLAINPALWDMLSIPNFSTDLSAAEVHFALAPLAADATSRRMSVELSDTVARVRF